MKSSKIAAIVTPMVIALTLGLGVAMMSSQPAHAADPTQSMQKGANAAKGEGTSACMFTNKDVPKTDPNYCASGAITDISNAFLYVLGAVSVLMLIYAGVRYTISGGDQNSIATAKKTMIYAVVGIVVAIMSYAIVNFVIGALI